MGDSTIFLSNFWKLGDCVSLRNVSGNTNKVVLTGLIKKKFNSLLEIDKAVKNEVRLRA